MVLGQMSRVASKARQKVSESYSQRHQQLWQPVNLAATEVPATGPVDGGGDVGADRAIEAGVAPDRPFAVPRAPIALQRRPNRSVSPRVENRLLSRVDASTRTNALHLYEPRFEPPRQRPGYEQAPPLDDFADLGAGHDTTEQVRLEFGDLQFEANYLEPVFCDVALFDATAAPPAARISEIVHLDLLPEDWRAKAKIFLPDGTGSCRDMPSLLEYTDAPRCRTAVFHLPRSLCRDNVFVVLHVSKLLHRDPTKATDLYVKQRPALKDQERMADAARSAAAGPLSAYRQSLAWGATALFGAHGSAIGREVDLPLWRQSKAVGDADRQKQLKELLDSARRGDAPAPRNKQQIYATLALDVHSAPRPRDNNTCSSAQAQQRSTASVAWGPFCTRPDALVDADTRGVGANVPRGVPARTVLCFAGSGLAGAGRRRPFSTVVNTLYLCPRAIERCGHRNISICVQLLDAAASNSKGVARVLSALPAVYPRHAGVDGLVADRRTEVTYHSKFPAFGDEVKLQLPLALMDTHHVLQKLDAAHAGTDPAVKKSKHDSHPPQSNATYQESAGGASVVRYSVLFEEGQLGVNFSVDPAHFSACTVTKVSGQAAAKGVQARDVMRSVNGQPITSDMPMEAIVDLVKGAARPLTIEFVRDDFCIPGTAVIDTREYALLLHEEGQMPQDYLEQPFEHREGAPAPQGMILRCSARLVSSIHAQDVRIAHFLSLQPVPPGDGPWDTNSLPEARANALEKATAALQQVCCDDSAAALTAHLLAIVRQLVMQMCCGLGQWEDGPFTPQSLAPGKMRCLSFYILLRVIDTATQFDEGLLAIDVARSVCVMQPFFDSCRAG
eukprot:g5574.t1